MSAYCERLHELVLAGARIREAHASTIACPTPESWATQLSRVELENLAETLRSRTGLSVVTVG